MYICVYKYMYIYYGIQGSCEWFKSDACGLGNTPFCVCETINVCLQNLQTNVDRCSTPVSTTVFVLPTVTIGKVSCLVLSKLEAAQSIGLSQMAQRICA